MINPSKPTKTDRALERSSNLLSKTFANPCKVTNDCQFEYFTNPSNVDIDKEDRERGNSIVNTSDQAEAKPIPVAFKPKSSLTPFLLLIALSLHGFFEGIALGIQSELNGVFFLGAAILSHKWAEAFTLVIFSIKKFNIFLFF
jgi:zinc transporter ZupT